MNAEPVNTAPPSFSVVVPTIGRDSLRACVDALASADGPLPAQVVLVDDRRAPEPPLAPPAPERLAGRVRVIAGPDRGPAAARNAGWRAVSTEWVVFVDDDVVVGPSWLAELSAELGDAPADLAGVQGRLDVPLPAHRRPTDWERNVAGLADARWITADLACRRTALAFVGGFDERFRRAYREDADLALRLLDAGYRLVLGERRSAHPVRPAPWWISVRLQAGNADDPVMRRLHGPDWRRRAAVPSGRRPRHLLVTAAGLAWLAAAATGRRRLAATLGAAWATGTAEFAAARIVPGPRTPGEIAAMITTSAVLPPVAVAHWLRGLVRAARMAPRTVPAGRLAWLAARAGQHRAPDAQRRTWRPVRPGRRRALAQHGRGAPGVR